MVLLALGAPIDFTISEKGHLAWALSENANNTRARHKHDETGNGTSRPGIANLKIIKNAQNLSVLVMSYTLI